MSRSSHLAHPRAASVLGAALAILITAPVGAHSPDPRPGSAWDVDERLEFRWRSGAEPPSAIKTAIRAAATDVTETKNSRAATFVYDSGGSSPIGYGAGATCGVDGIACYTRSAPSGGFTMWLREHGRVFDWGTLRWCQMSANPPNGCYDAETIALDEFGHIEGLGHHVNYADDRDYTDAVVQTLSRTKPREGWNMHVLGRCDIAALQIRYDVPNTTAKTSTCLDLDTVLTLVAADTSIAYNAVASLTATLRIVDDADYGRLGGNALNGRTVKLQRRPPGSTTWTTVGTMPAGSSNATYTLGVRLLTTTEFRAVFSAPSGEGLNGDTSGTVRVSVAACSGVCPQAAPGT
jgi:hypothetical protein